jgi:hypothetical protein
MATRIIGPEVPTSFDKGMPRLTLLMIQFILVMVLLVFLIDGLTKPDWQRHSSFQSGGFGLLSPIAEHRAMTHLP